MNTPNKSSPEYRDGFEEAERQFFSSEDFINPFAPGTDQFWGYEAGYEVLTK